MPALERPSGFSARLNGLSEAVVLALLVALPSFLNLATVRVFEEEKVLLLRAGALLILAGAVWRWRGQRDLIRQPVNIAFGLMTLVLVVATALALAPREALLGAYLRRHGLVTWFALGVAFFEACIVARSPAGRQRILAALVLGSVWPSLYALIQSMGIDPVTWTDTFAGRTASTIGNPLLMAGYLVVVIPLTAIQVLRASGYSACLVLQLAALAATGSRGPALALGVGGLCFASVILWTTAYRRVALVSLVGAAILTFALVVSPAVRPAALSHVFDATTGSGRVRVLIWQGVRQLMNDSGWRLWIGYGPESLHRLSPRYYIPEIGEIEGSEAMPDRAHNETLDTFVNAGLLGVALQIAFFAAAFLTALRTDDRWLRAGVAAAVVAHIAEIQLGIATVASRLAFLAAIALVAGARTPALRPKRTSARKAPPAEGTEVTPWVALGIIALVSAAVPMLSELIATLVGGGGSGDVSALSTYLFRLSLVTPILYGALLVSTYALAGSVSTPVGTGAPWLRTVMLVVAMLAAVPLSITASRADIMAKAGAAFEQSGRLTEARTAHAEAFRLAPSDDTFATNFGHALMDEAAQLEPAEALTSLTAAEAALSRAEVLNPQDPYPPRNLGSLARVRARTLNTGDREGALEAADRHYRRATERAPQLPVLWVEWANVDAERRRFADAYQKLERAALLDATRYDVWLLRGLVSTLDRKPADALSAYGRALASKPGDVAALRGRSVALASLGRTDEARADAEAVLRQNPTDSLALRLRAELGQ